MKRIFVCSPLRGNIEQNLRKTKEYCRCVLTQCGAVPIAPHLYFTQFLNELDPAERKAGIRCGLELLAGCDELYYFGDTITSGMAVEIEEARRLGIPVRHIPSAELENYSIQNGELSYV